MPDKRVPQTPDPEPEKQPYEAPRAEDVPAEDGPTVTAPGPTTDARGPEWRPQPPQR